MSFFEIIDSSIVSTQFYYNKTSTQNFDSLHLISLKFD